MRDFLELSSWRTKGLVRYSVEVQEVRADKTDKYVWW